MLQNLENASSLISICFVLLLGLLYGILGAPLKFKDSYLSISNCLEILFYNFMYLKDSWEKFQELRCGTPTSIILKALFVVYKCLNIYLILVQKLSNFFLGLCRTIEIFGHFLRIFH